MAWSFVNVSSAVVVTSGNITLTEPANVAQGDLLVACIAYRSNAAFTLPSGWSLVAPQQSSGNTSTTTSTSIGSGLMAYIVRGSSAPALAFTRTNGDVALGRIAAFRGVNQSSPYDTGSANTLAVNGTAVTTTGITTAQGAELLVMAECGADNTTASAATAASDPTSGWSEHIDTNTSSGADTMLAISSATKGAAGATGTLQYTAGNSSRHVCIVGAFNLAPVAGASASTLGTFTQSGSSNVPIAAASAQAVSTVTQTASGALVSGVSGSASQTLAAVSNAAQATVPLYGAGVGALGAFGQSATAAVRISSTSASHALAAFVQSGTGTLPAACIAAQALGSFWQSTSGRLPINGVA